MPMRAVETRMFGGVGEREWSRETGRERIDVEGVEIGDGEMIESDRVSLSTFSSFLITTPESALWPNPSSDESGEVGHSVSAGIGD